MGLVSALLINIGTLSTPWIKSMQKAAAKARELGKPWVLDPVGAGATSLRTKTATDLVLSYKPTVIRGNPSEIMALAKSVCKDLDVQASGIDRSTSCGKSVDFIKLQQVCENQTCCNFIFTCIKLVDKTVPDKHQACMLTINLKQTCYRQARASDASAS